MSKKSFSYFDQFNLITVDLMLELYKKEVLSDKIVSSIHKLNMWYYTILEKIEILEEKANIDYKTGLLKYKDNYLEKLVKVASSTMEGLNKENYYITYLRFDIDDFSIFNNKYGHDVGDKVLKKLSALIKKNTRPMDYCIRYGGEEFDILLPNTDAEGVIGFANKFYKELKKLKLKIDNKYIPITVSAGVSVLEISYTKLRQYGSKKLLNIYKTMQKEADDALYKSKYMGKNRFNIYESNEKEHYKEYRQSYIQQSGKRG